TVRTDPAFHRGFSVLAPIDSASRRPFAGSPVWGTRAIERRRRRTVQRSGPRSAFWSRESPLVAGLRRGFGSMHVPSFQLDSVALVTPDLRCTDRGGHRGRALSVPILSSCPAIEAEMSRGCRNGASGPQVDGRSAALRAVALCPIIGL